MRHATNGCSRTARSASNFVPWGRPGELLPPVQISPDPPGRSRDRDPGDVMQGARLRAQRRQLHRVVVPTSTAVSRSGARSCRTRRRGARSARLPRSSSTRSSWILSSGRRRSASTGTTRLAVAGPTEAPQRPIRSSRRPRILAHEHVDLAGAGRQAAAPRGAVR